MNRIMRILTAAAAAAALTACGGSGGGGGTPAPSVELATITSTNAPAIAGAVMASTFEGSDLGNFANLAGGLPVASAPASGFAKAVMPGGTPSPLDGLAQAPFNETIDCPGGGSLTMSGNIANPETLSGGDNIGFTYSACNDGVSVVDGGFSMVVSSFSGDLAGGSFSLVVDVTLTDFSVDEGGETSTAAGTVTIDMSVTSPSAIAIEVSSTSLTVTAGGTTHTLSGFSVEQTLDAASGAYTMTVTGRLQSSAFDGTVDFETSADAALSGTGDGFAFTGELVITGANGTSITVITLDATMVRLEVDTDGDGETDDIIDRSWDELV